MVALSLEKIKRGGAGMNSVSKGRNEGIKSVMKDFVERAVNLYENMGDQPVCPSAREDALELLRERQVPQEGRPIEEVFEEMLQEVYSGAPLAQHPRNFSCVPSTASLFSWMGDVMTGAFNPHAGCRSNAPAAGMIEEKLIRWMCGLAGYPKGSGGVFVSGGSMANLTALTAARDLKLPFSERSRGVVYVTDQTHSSVSKGLHIIGFDRQQIHIVPTDGAFRMNVSALKEAVRKDRAAGKKPFAVVASAGSTNTGSVDPLREIGLLCREYNMWMHVDGAFGASALLSKRQRKLLSGIELSDSLSWDAHKWMMQTYSCSVVLVRRQSDLLRSFSAHPEYLKDAESAEGGTEFWDLGPELTRPARSLKLWLTLQAVGSRGMERMIDHGCAMAELAECVLRTYPGWEIVSSASLGIVNFRYVPFGISSESHLNRINQEIAREITASGYAQVFTTELQGKKVLRMCTIHPQTTEEDIHNTIERLRQSEAARRAGRQLDKTAS